MGKVSIMRESNKKLIVVLGMHRSGTSAVTRGLQALGVNLGNSFASPLPDNEKGFYEDIEIKRLNEDILKALDSNWDSLSLIPTTAFDQEIFASLKLHAIELMRARISHQAFGLKDPRIARLLPFWEGVFQHLNISPSYVITVRHPMSVAQSLQKRDDFYNQKSYYLWLEHVIPAILETSGFNRVVVDFDLLITNPQSQLKRIAIALNLPFNPDSEGVKEYSGNFLDTGLRHTQFEFKDLNIDSSVPKDVINAYEILAQLARDETDIDEKVEEIFKQLSNRLLLLSPLLNCVTHSDKKNAKLKKTVTERDEQLNALTAQLNALTAQLNALTVQLNVLISSRSWRITRPLRVIARLLRYGVIKELRKIYHRLPLTLSTRKRIRYFYNLIFANPYQTIRKHLRALIKFHPPSIKPAMQQPATPDYVIWSVIDWHFRHQRPQQLAQAFANSGRRVFYVSACLIEDGRAGFSLEPLDAEGRLFQVKLYNKGNHVIYSSAPSNEEISRLRASIGEVLDWADSRQIISLVQHPFWYDIATVLPNSRVVYDCMDHHEGFGNTAEEILSLERALLRNADLTVTTSEQLDQLVAQHTKNHVLIRNACDFEHFSSQPASVYCDKQGRRIIGYYGAIAEWFDLDLVEAIAKRFPECCILLIGADTINAQVRLRQFANISFVGEVPYAELPYYLHAFDVCLLPFKIIPLTLATNPVKVYEYLSAGKALVSVDLPEIKQFDGLVLIAKNTSEFISALANVLNSEQTIEIISRRQAFAKEQTWEHRAQAVIGSAEAVNNDPKVSIIVVTYNNLELTRDCLISLDLYSHYSALEIIVVDNASVDGSKEFLSEWAIEVPNRKLILNADNRGFAAANNQGLAIATGEYLVLLNNDTYVTPGWIRTLLKHLQGDKTIGLIGPVTNNIGNAAKININYQNMEEMLVSSASYTRRHIGKTFPLHTAAFFCVMIPKDVYERVGTLDEAFGRGFFEDDDYCRRVEQHGLRIVCAEDVFIHHQLSASFDKLKSQERQNLFEQNKAIYEAKWGKWEPHEYRI